MDTILDLTAGQEGKTQLARTKPCICCGKQSIVKLLFTELAHYSRGAFVQDAFPRLSPMQRELLISGTHEACWDGLFSK